MISFEYLYDLLDSSHHSNDIVHQFVAIDGLNLQLSIALHAFLIIALFAAKAVVVSTRDDSHWIVEFVAKRTLDLRHDAVVKMLEVFKPLLEHLYLILKGFQLVLLFVILS